MSLVFSRAYHYAYAYVLVKAFIAWALASLLKPRPKTGFVNKVTVYYIIGESFWAFVDSRLTVFFIDLKIDPVNITNTVPSSTSVGLSWQPPDRYKLGEDVSVYRVEIVDLLRGERFNYTVNSSNVELDFLKPFTNYEFKVFGSTSSWEGNITDTISLQTKEDGRLS